MYGQTPDAVRDKTDRLAAVCRARDAEIGAVAPRFILAHPAVAAVIPGTKPADETRPGGGS